MPLPGFSPRKVVQALCNTCSTLMSVNIEKHNNGNFRLLVHTCTTCNYSFEEIPDHLNGILKRLPDPIAAEREQIAEQAKKADKPNNPSNRPKKSHQEPVIVEAD